MKYLPPELRDWYFPFDWGVEKLWALDVPTESTTLAALQWHFDLPFWSVEKGLHFDLCPRELIPLITEEKS